MNFLNGFAAGTSADFQIKEGHGEGWLITDGFDEALIAQACYELRASNIYYELDRIDHEKIPRRFELEADGFILLKPKQLVTIITFESLRLPENVLGRVLTKGKLFSVGVVPVNTYADPGFEGRLGIVVANLSYNYIKIVPGQPIAKIEFSKLRSPVSRTYKGQHGYQTQMWPVPHEMIVSRDELHRQRDARLLSPLDELELTHGPVFGSFAKRLFGIERKLILVSIIYLTLTVLLVAYLAGTNSQFALTQWVAVFIGVISNIAFALLTNAATSLRRRW